MSLVPLPELSSDVIYDRCDRYGWPTARSKGLYFVQDWTSVNFPKWKEACSDFIGKENVGYLEIGIYQGFSACWFFDTILTTPSSYATLIDTKILPELHQNIEKIGYSGKLEVIQGESQTKLKTVNKKFDIIYIDGNHTTVGTLTDGNLSWPLLKENGIMIFDDYGWDRHPDESQRPKGGIDLFLNNIKNKYDLLLQAYQVIIKKRKFEESGVIQSNGNQRANPLFQGSVFTSKFNSYKQQRF